MICNGLHNDSFETEEAPYLMESEVFFKLKVVPQFGIAKLVITAPVTRGLKRLEPIYRRSCWGWGLPSETDWRGHGGTPSSLDGFC